MHNDPVECVSSAWLLEVLVLVMPLFRHYLRVHVSTSMFTVNTTGGALYETLWSDPLKIESSVLLLAHSWPPRSSTSATPVCSQYWYSPHAISLLLLFPDYRSIIWRISLRHVPQNACMNGHPSLVCLPSRSFLPSPYDHQSFIMSSEELSQDDRIVVWVNILFFSEMDAQSYNHLAL